MIYTKPNKRVVNKVKPHNLIVENISVKLAKNKTRLKITKSDTHKIIHTVSSSFEYETK